MLGCWDWGGVFELKKKEEGGVRRGAFAWADKECEDVGLLF